MSKCDHDWERIDRWVARYRCRKCQAYGYRKAALSKGYKARGYKPSITEYRCQHPGCENPAQVSNKPGQRKCFQHWPKKGVDDAERSQRPAR